MLTREVFKNSVPRSFFAAKPRNLALGIFPQILSVTHLAVWDPCGRLLHATTSWHRPNVRESRTCLPFPHAWGAKCRTHLRPHRGCGMPRHQQHERHDNSQRISAPSPHGALGQVKCHLHASRSPFAICPFVASASASGSFTHPVQDCPVPVRPVL